MLGPLLIVLLGGIGLPALALYRDQNLIASCSAAKGAGLCQVWDTLVDTCLRYNIPIGIAVGWALVENGGFWVGGKCSAAQAAQQGCDKCPDPKTHDCTTIGPGPTDHERGAMQISNDEWIDNRYPAGQFTKLSTDMNFSAYWGVRLIAHYADLLREKGVTLYVTDGSELFWRLVKLCHAIGSPRAITGATGFPTGIIGAAIAALGAPELAADMVALTSWPNFKAFALQRTNNGWGLGGSNGHFAHIDQVITGGAPWGTANASVA